MSLRITGCYYEYSALRWESWGSSNGWAEKEVKNWALGTLCPSYELAGGGQKEKPTFFLGLHHSPLFFFFPYTTVCLEHALGGGHHGCRPEKQRQHPPFQKDCTLPTFIRGICPVCRVTSHVIKPPTTSPTPHILPGISSHL